MAKVKKASLLNKSVESTSIVKNLHKTKKIYKRKGAVSKGFKQIRKIFIDKKTGKQHIKYETDNKGVVYIEHIPHGFYEDQIKDFFKQFGEVTAVNLPKGKNDNAKGFAFVQFHHPEVAKIAAEAMNNYLMFNRLIKTKYIPPEQQKSYLFRKAESAKLRKRTVKDLAEMRKKQDAKRKVKHLDSTGQKEFKMKVKKKLKSLRKRCAGLGLDFDCQVADESPAVKLLSVKKLNKSPELVKKTSKSPNKMGGELVPVKLTGLKKTSKTPKPSKKTASKPIKMIDEDLVPVKLTGLKKTSNTTKPSKMTAPKPLQMMNLEILPVKMKALKNSSESPKRSTRLNKTVDKCLKKIDKAVPPVLKKMISENTELVKKKVLRRKVRKQD